MGQIPNRHLYFVIVFMLVIFVDYAVGAGDTSRMHSYTLLDTPFFEKAAISFSQTARKRGYETKVFTGSSAAESLSGSFKAEDIQLFEKSKSKTHLHQMADAIKKDLANGRINPGDRVLIQILTHGGEKKAGEASHEVLVGSTWVSLDLLKEVTAELEAMGVKVGIVDGSCFSGNSLALGGPKTCVVTSQIGSRDAKADSGANGTFAEFLWNELNESLPSPDRSLEHAFLQARAERNAYSRDFSWKFDRPQMSSPAAMRIQERLEKIFRGVDEMQFFRGRDVKDLECKIQQLDQNLETIRETAQISIDVGFQKLAGKIREYSRLRLESVRLQVQLRSDRGSDPSLYARDTDLGIRMRSLVKEIYQMESTFYQNAYARENEAGGNPCRDFLL